MPYTDFSKLPRELLNAQEWQPKGQAEESSTDGSSQPVTQPGTPSEPARSRRTANTSTIDPAERRYHKSGGQVAPTRRRKVKTNQEAREEERSNNKQAKPQNGVLAHRPVPPKPTPVSTRARRQPIFDFVQDNAAKTAWRRGEEPAERYKLYKPAEEVEDRIRMYDFLAELGVRCNSHITPPQTGNDQDCLIYGSSKAVADTKRGIAAWLRCLDDGGTSQRRSHRNFAKESSTAGDKYMRNMKHIGRQARIRAFQQAPPDESSLGHHGHVPWTMDEVSPRQVYGLNLEAFDNLRMSLQCFISFDDRQNYFRLSSNKPDSVQIVQDRIAASSTAYQVRSKPCVRTLFCADLPFEGKIRLQEAMMHNKPFLLPDIPTNWPPAGEWPLESHLQPTLHDCIGRLPHYSGRLQLQVVFGNLQLQTYKKSWTNQEMSPSEFRKNLSLPTIRGSVHSEIMRGPPQASWLRLVQQNSSLLSADPCIVDLEHVLPEISAHFTIHQFEKPTLSLNLYFARVGDEPYEERSRDWCREDGSSQTVIMDSVIVCENFSWALSAAHHRTLETSSIEPRMQAFADSVRVNHSDSRGLEESGSPLLRWNTTSSSLRPSMLEQRRKFRHQMQRNSLWYLELTYHETFDARFENAHRAWWSATLRSSSWDAVLSENYSLAIGESATWPAEIATFFPPTGMGAQGISELLTMVQEARGILHRVFDET